MAGSGRRTRRDVQALFRLRVALRHRGRRRARQRDAAERDDPGFLAGRPDLAQELFGGQRLPTLVQYDPLQRFFEIHDDGTLLFSADGTVPLIRYHIADQGGLLGHDELLGFCRQHGFDPQAELAELAGVKGAAPQLPFCYVFGRSFHTVSYFGANVYPENVTVGLEQPHIAGWVTGKFVVEAIEDTDRNARLRITIELAPGQRADADRATLAASSIRAQLRRLNSEFAHYVPAERQLPEVVLRPSGDPEYFPAGVKHRYTRPPDDSPEQTTAPAGSFIAHPPLRRL